MAPQPHRHVGDLSQRTSRVLRDPVWGAIGVLVAAASLLLATGGGGTSAAITGPPPGSPTPVTGYADFVLPLHPNAACGRTEVDLDTPDVRGLDPTDSGFGDALDFSYDACRRGLTYPSTSQVRLGRGRPGTPTRASCAADARSNVLGDPEPISAIQAGTALCAITSEGAVAWIVVRGRGAPYQGQLPTLTLAITLWR